MGTTLEMANSSSHDFSGGFEKTDDIVHYRTGPRVSSGFVNSRDGSSSNSSLNVSPDTKAVRSNNSYNRRKVVPSIKPGTTKSNTATSSSSIAHAIAKDSGVSSIKSTPTSTATSLEHRRNFATKAKVAIVPDYEEVVDRVPEESAFTPSKMPPNNRSQSQDDGSAIISGHKIALNVHYDSEKQNGHIEQNGVLGTPPGSAGNSSCDGVPPVMIDEQPALRELDEVIASAQRSTSALTSGSPAHAAEQFVDAPEVFQVEEAVQLDKITHVDRVSSGPSTEEGLSVAASPHPSASSLGDLRAPSPSSPSSVEEAEQHSPLTGSTASVDGGALSSSPGTPTKHSPVPLPVKEAAMTVTRDQYLDGPDQIVPAATLKTWQPNGAVSLRVQKEGLAANTPISVPSLLKRTAEKYPNHNAMMEKQGNEWVAINYTQYYQLVRTAAKAFIKLGLEPYHGVCILGFNSPEWFISDLAAIFAGGFAAGIYTTNSPDACQHCALNCQAQIWVVEDQKQLDKVLKIRPNLPSLKTIIQYKGKPTAEGVLSWEEMMEIGRKESEVELEERLKRIAVNQCCTLIYTSGTTGAPKGVMLSHDNVTWTTLSASVYFKMTPGKETVISYLPLSHVAAQLADIYMTMVNAGTAYFAQPDALKGSLGATLKEVRPTAFLGVPRVWEKIYEKMMDVGRKTKGVKKSIATWAKSVGLEANDRKQKSDYSKPLGFSIANAIVFQKVKGVLGLDRCKIFLSGAAPISPDIVKYFHSLDICLVEIYGMSESTGPHTTGIESAFKVGSAGRSLPGCQTLISNPDAGGNGEVCMAGRNVAMGYLLKEETTNETIDDDGLLHTGDIGKLDEGNFLFITGRIKELIITAGGENIPPVLIEDLLKGELPCISNAMLIGDKRKFLSILLTLKTNMNLDTGEALDTLSPACIEWCEEVGSSAKTIYDVLSGPDPKIMRAIQDGIDRTNKNASSNAQKIQKWTILPRDFTVLGDELGPTMKLKRPVVSKKYTETIERFYQ